MFYHLPIPYPDELLYSVIARYCTYLSIHGSNITRAMFETKSTKLRADLPCRLEKVSEKTFSLWRLSSNDILNKLTLFPYYEPFLPQKSAVKKIAGLLYGDSATTGSIGVNSFRVKSPQFLRFCAQCKNLDLAAYGETYWHRTHQLPGVLVCPEHGIHLINTSALVLPKQSQYADATIITANATDHSFPLTANELSMAKLVAAHCQKLLMKNNPRWKSQNLSATYRKAAIQRGYTKIPGILSPSKFQSAFMEFYEERFLEMIGINVNSRVNWVNTIFHQNYKQQVHPLEHVLIQVFLEHKSVVTSFQPFGPGPWKCPNPYGQHDDPFPIKKIATRTMRSSEVVARAKCTCGFFFNFQKTAEDDNQLPIVKHIWSYGPTWKRNIETLAAAGMSFHDIAKVMSINTDAARKLTDFESKLENRKRKDIEQLRQEWLHVLQKQSITQARKNNYGLYQYLLKHDHEWMMGQRQPRQKKVDWERRDTEWSQLLEDTAMRIASEIPVRRVAKSVIVKEACLNLRIFTELHHLPKCESVINRLSESYTSYRRRQEEAKFH
ncbi:MAG: hypothetical protein CXR31_10105 [Geobacter sp.]|nr:MAG: hypothetical protein CXR31_10105 [Geobacter sp.]